MLFELPIVYKVTGVKRGNRRATSYDVAEMVEVDIPVVHPADAPIAVEWIATVPEGLKEKSGISGHYIASAFSPTPPDGRLHTRLVGESHYCPVVGITIAGWTGPLVDPDLLNETRGVGMWRDHFGVNLLPSGPFKGLDSLSRSGLVVAADGIEDTFDRVERTNRGDALAKLRKSVSECAFVGGVLYRACSEPKVIIAVASTRGSDGVWQNGLVPFVTCDPDFAARDLGPRLVNYHVHELVDWKKLVSKARRDNPFRELFEPMYAGRAPVVRDAMNDAHYRLTREVRRAAGSFMSQAGVRRLDEMTTPVLVAYCGVVDAFKNLAEPGGMDALDSAVSRFIEVASGGNAHEYSLAQTITRLSELLGDRPVEFAAVVPSAVS
ncbi:hypothetical protein OIU34_21470 [Pararhizobium sp. BT-229]|uniref:hypothetical protein n=1 Tax=Pararhizobium sp. BT-229 TaxID=2986923 RepID=UPI0021F7D89B|nr:hypothetical protein [Pararhizobium sp. BT-229]MCV9964463.1 hypothetical protein [Pararhizobium sp. BT-229]